ncbi:MAG TPA: hypothetical protein VFS67_26350 [Polyangiaceae bacterium]|nr:hypothetical protein [Polyangiaceae bacterium]
MRLTSWGDALLFAQTNQAQLSVPLSELDAVWKGTDGCTERFSWVDLPGAFPPGHSAP